MTRFRIKTKEIVLLLPTIMILTMFLNAGLFASALSTTVTVSPQTSSVQVGDNISVSLQLSNVQNLYGLDVELKWNNSIVQHTGTNLKLGVESFPDGVLHGTRVNYDLNTLAPGDVYVAQSTASQPDGDYHLIATSTNPADSFNGSGTIVSLTFSVIGAGTTDLELVSLLADHPAENATSNLIVHTDTKGTLTSLVSPSRSPQQSGSPVPSSTQTLEPLSSPSPSIQVSTSPSGTPSNSPSLTNSPNPTATNSQQPTPTPEQHSDFWLETGVVVAVILIVAVGLAVLVLHKRGKK
jgi:hypothetical protein